MSELNYKNILFLYSGGLDSTCMLFNVVNKNKDANIEVLSFKYGQRHSKELTVAKKICKKLRLHQTILDVSNIFNVYTDYSTCMSKSSKNVLTVNEYIERCNNHRKDVLSFFTDYIPNRNGCFINIASSVGLQLFKNCKFIIYHGIYEDNTSDVWFPDCTNEYLKSMDESIKLSSKGLVNLYVPDRYFTKKDFVELGLNNGMSKDIFKQTHSCMRSNGKECGKCTGCTSKILALVAGMDYNVKDIMEQFDLNKTEANRLYLRGLFYKNVNK